MLYPSDPSCSSSKDSEIRAGERSTQQPKLQEIDPVVLSFAETQTPNFCIRDYVFASRSRSDGSSWPFRHGLLKLCLKHGIRDPLPPFEPASSVRELFCRTSAAESEKNIKVDSSQVAGEICLLNGEHNSAQTVSCSPLNGKFVHCVNKDDDQGSSEEDKVYNLINEDYEIGSTLTNQCNIEGFPAQLGEPAEKKCGLISETSRAEDIASTSTASDLMASKVCPVCKTFSSTSNTTLNAHMDQCLSMASDAAKIVDKIPKLMAKPTKKRLMEDIYATAPHCSLEDLDRRNGTTWATDLTLATPPTEAKNLKFSQSDDGDDRRSTEGAVYVDSNGIKVRILSKFNDSLQVISKKVFRSSKNVNLVGDGKISSISQKKHVVGEKYDKKMKLKMKNKKLSSLKLLKNKAEPEIDHDEESHQEEGSADRLSSEQERAHVSCGTSTLQKWHCSKRSYLPKKICKKIFLKNMENPDELATQITSPEKRSSASGSHSSAKRHLVKLSHAPESMIADNSANNPLQNMANEVRSSQGFSSKGISTGALRLKFSKAYGSFVPSKSGRNGDMFIGRKQKSFDFPVTYGGSTENCNLSLKTKKISTLSNLSARMPGKHKRKREISSNTIEEQQRCVEAAITSFLDQEVTDRGSHSGSCQCHNVRTKSSLLQTDSMIAKSVNGEVLPGLFLNSDDKTSQTMSMKECGISKKRVFGKQDEETSDNLENRGVESQAGATSTESSACLTSHGDFGGPDTPRENCSSASAPVVPNQESNLIISGEPSGSPVSSFSASPASLNNSLTKASDRELVSMGDKEGAQALDMDHNQQCKIDSAMNKPDYHPCCCSRQSIMASTMPTSKPKLIPNLSSSLPAYSIFHSDAGNITSLESPTGSIMTTSPSCGTPSQSSSNSILRLMGKNLMVTHNEESPNLLKFDSPAKDSKTAQSLPSPLRFTSYVSAPNNESFPFAVCSPAPLMTVMQARNSVHQGDDLMMRSALLPVPVSHTMFQGSPYPYFLPQNQLLLREIGSSSTSSLEVPANLLPRPFLFRPPSATHLNPPLFYPQTLR